MKTDTDHGPMDNQEAVLLRENDKLSEAILKEKQGSISYKVQRYDLCSPIDSEEAAYVIGHVADGAYVRFTAYDALEAELFLERSLRVAAQEAIAPQAERIAELERRLENAELGAGERLHQANRELTALRNAVEVQKHDERALRELLKEAQTELLSKSP